MTAHLLRDIWTGRGTGPSRSQLWQFLTHAGRLSCDVFGMGMFVVEKKTLSCVFEAGRQGPRSIPVQSTSSAWSLARLRRAICIWV